MKNTNNYFYSVFNICFKNLAVIGFFIVLSLAFHKWWIVLFSIVFQSKLPYPVNPIDCTPDRPFIMCSFCGEILFVQDFENSVHNEMKQHSWKRISCSRGWINVCPHCEEKYNEIIENFSFEK